MTMQPETDLHVLGRHVIAEYHGCSPGMLDDTAGLEDLLVTAARRAGATPIKREFHHFAPHGVSGVVIIAESHLTIHTWPEHGYAAVDFFTCGESVDPMRAHACLCEALGATTAHHVTLQRGIDRPLEVGSAAPGNLWRVRPGVAGKVHAVRVAPDCEGEAGDLWLSDDQGDQCSAFRVDRVLYAGRTAFAQAEIVDTSAFGKLLSLDGMAQSAASDEVAYHEALVVPAFVLAREPVRRVLILGGGEGATLREVLRFPEVERCVMVDIDPELVALCRRHLPEWSAGAFDDPRAELRFEDARQLLERTASRGERYDLIVGDLPEAEIGGPLEALYSASAFELIRRCLSPSGIYAGQVGSLQMGSSVLGPPAILAGAAASFGAVSPYVRYIPSYGAEWAFAVAEVAPAGAPLTAAGVDERLARRRDPAWPCATYDGLTHQRLFSLPKDVRAALAGAAA
jgi:spermidine synthase